MKLPAPMPPFQAPPPQSIALDVARALMEDLGPGDLTAGLIAPEARANVEVISREAGILCGGPWFEQSFRSLDPGIEIQWLCTEGATLTPDRLLCRLSGNTRALLSAERTALNFLQSLSGTASLTARYLAAVAGTGVRLLDSRKTIPGLRQAQKYAVRCGGGANHRMGLYDAVLIKENHILAAGSISAALQQAQRLIAPGIIIEIEVENLSELDEALNAGATRVLLDNFSLDALRDAVALNAGRARLEASGNMSLEGIRAVAETGVQDISIGALTKNVQALDLSMRFV
jgi:nicotinate-nucleotide pyrophosphorylase (carboxylating)